MPKGVYKRTKQGIENMRQARLNNPSRYWLGKNRSEETKQKIREKLRGRKHPAVSKRLKNRKLTTKHRNNIKLGLLKYRKTHPNYLKGKDSGGYIDGRSSRVYYCKEFSCNNIISYTN